MTPAGIGRENFTKGIAEPKSRVQLIKRFPEEAGTFLAAEVGDFMLEDFLPNINSKRLPRHTQFALAASILALRDAKLTIEEISGKPKVVIIGSSLMDFASINKGIDLILHKGIINGMPGSIYSASVSSIGAAVSDYLGGITQMITLQSACCAGLDSIGHAANMVSSGEVDFAVCGGTEAPLYFHPMLELRMTGLAPGNPEFPESQCRPFDRWRTTGVIGEGCCVLILEPEASPRPGYSFIEGYAFASDPAGTVGEGLAESIRLALANGHIRPNQIECINAWGSGHKIVDRAEANALVHIFGPQLSKVPAVSLKGSIGNPLGAAGAIQVGCAAVCMATNTIPPTVNWNFPDPDCPLNLSAKARFVSHKTTLVNAHGLSGTNASVVLSR